MQTMCSTEPSEFGLDGETCYQDDTGEIKRHRVSIEFTKQLAFIQRNIQKTVHPQLMTEPLLFISVPRIFELFFEAERALWDRIVSSPFPHQSLGETGQIILSSAIPVIENYGDNGIGEAFLRHANTSNEIQQYFVKLDPRRCCVNARTVDDHMQLPHPLKCVKNENSTKRSDESRKGGNSSRASQRNRVIFVHKLSINEEKIYMQILLCAYQPVLSTPLEEPSTVTSPASACKYVPQEKGSSESFIDATAIDPEMLFTRVMRAFKINLAYHNKLKEELRRSLPSRDTSRALAVDLADQLHRLQANECTFYCKDQFDDPDCYEDWREKQIVFLQKLMNKWCHKSTDIKSYKLGLFNAHGALLIIVEKFLRLDLEEKQEVVKNSRRYQSMKSVMTTASEKLLKEFCLRFGVGKTYRKLAILSSMINNLDYTDWYLRCLLLTLDQTIEEIEELENLRFLVNKEKEMIHCCLDTLHYKIEYGLIKIFTLYPHNISTEGVHMLLSLLSSVTKAKDDLECWDPDLDEKPTIETMLPKYLKLAVIENYKLLKEKADMNCIDSQNQYQSSLTVDIIWHVLQDVRMCMASFEDLCSDCKFLTNHCPDIQKIVAEDYYAQLTADVKILCFANTKTIRTSMVDYKMIGLSFRLDKLDRDWGKYIPTSNQKWRTYYKIVLTVALRAITENILREIPSYVMNDPYEILDLSKNLRTSSKPPQTEQAAPICQSSSSVSDRKGSSAFILVKTIRSSLRKGSLINIEGNLNGSWNPPVLGSPLDEKNSESSNHEEINANNLSEELDEVDATNTLHGEGNSGSQIEEDTLDLLVAEYVNDVIVKVIDSLKQEKLDSVDYSFDPLKVSTGQSADDITPSNGIVHRQRISETDEQLKFHGDDITSELSFNGNIDLILHEPSDRPVSQPLPTGNGIECSVENGEKTGESENKGLMENLKINLQNERKYSFDGKTSCNKQGVRKKYQNVEIEFPLANNGFVMTTSSLTDLLIVCSRLISFSKAVCSLVVPSDRLHDAEEDRYYNLRIDSLSNVLVSIKELVIMYSLTLLSLDICGSKMFEESKRFDNDDIKVLQLLKENQKSILSGCRHCITLDVIPKQPKCSFICKSEVLENSLFREPCILLEKIMKESMGYWELITKEMCLRINNIYMLLKLLPCLQKKAAQCLRVNTDILLLDLATSSSSLSPKHIDLPPSTENMLLWYLKPAESHLKNVLKLQIKLLVCRVMDIFDKMFCALFPLRLGNKSVHEQMASCKHFLVMQIKFLHQVLYEHCVKLFAVEIWESINLKYHSILDSLQMGKDNPRPKAKRLLELFVYTRNYVMIDRTMESEFYHLMKPVLFRLELFTLSLEKLRFIYNETKSETVFRICDSAQAELTFSEIVHLLKYELRQQTNGKPSFTGKKFLDVLVANISWLNGLTSLMKYNQCLANEAKAICIAKNFLQKDIIRVSSVVSKRSRKPGEREHSGKRPWKTNDSNDSTASTFSHESEEFYEEGVYYTFHTRSDPKDVQLIGKLHSIIRSHKGWIKTAIQKDIVDLFRYSYRVDVNDDIRAFFTENALSPPTMLRSTSCFW